MTGEAPRPQPKPAKRPPKPRKALVRTRMKRRPPRRLKGAGSDPKYLAWVRTQPCHVNTNHHGTVHYWQRGVCDCEGRINAHHAKHLSQGGTDRDAVPLCDLHHRQWHNAGGVFYGLSKAARAEWAKCAIAATQAAWSRA